MFLYFSLQDVWINLCRDTTFWLCLHYESCIWLRILATWDIFLKLVSLLIIWGNLRKFSSNRVLRVPLNIQVLNQPTKFIPRTNFLNIFSNFDILSALKTFSYFSAFNLCQASLLLKYIFSIFMRFVLRCCNFQNSLFCSELLQQPHKHI